MTSPDYSLEQLVQAYNDARAVLPHQLAIAGYRRRHPKPDLDVVITQVGGGAAPIGYVAQLWSDELHPFIIAEGYTEAYVHWATVLHLYLSNAFLSFPDASTTREEIRSQIEWVPYLKWALEFEIEDCCAAIDTFLLPWSDND